MKQPFRVIRGAEAEPATPRQGALPPFEEALAARLDRLFAFAMRLTRGDAALAEDLVQEASLKAFRGYGGVRSPDRLTAWLFRILVNTHINEFHRQSREPGVADVELSDDLLDPAHAPSPPTPEQRLFEFALGGDLQKALDALPLEFRTVVWLCDVEELSYREASEVVGCPVGTVASRLYRGHALLREYLRECGRRREAEE
jgi:RNA polymerase sigma-70 factor (ECF subfamily)